MTPVSVVIPAFNAAQTLPATLKALQAQVDAPGFEVIVVDNASTDDTADVARAYGATVLCEPMRGPAAARNCGLRHASGDIIAHLDADTVPSRRWLAELCAPFASEEVLVAGNTVCYPPQTAAERYVQAVGLHSAERAIVRDEFPFVPSLNMAVRRDAALSVGGWNQRLLTGEDVDFSHRLLKHCATHICYREKAIVYHRTRSDPRELRRQAIGYGAGAAELYLLYPDEVRWDVTKTLKLIGIVAGRSTAGAAATLGAALGVVDRRKAEFLAYHAFWTRGFWFGFARRMIDARRGLAW
jgi:glycosyltransferase involved in cell wall biosynthesis